MGSILTGVCSYYMTDCSFSKIRNNQNQETE